MGLLSNAKRLLSSANKIGGLNLLESSAVPVFAIDPAGANEYESEAAELLPTFNYIGDSNAANQSSAPLYMAAAGSSKAVAKNAESPGLNLQTIGLVIGAGALALQIYKSVK